MKEFSKSEEQNIEKHMIIEQVRQALVELIDIAGLKEGSILVVGCSTSEILGKNIGKHPSDEVGEWIIEAIGGLLDEKGIFLAAQCCEHYNRALVISDKLPGHGDRVNAVPKCHAGGSFARAAYNFLDDPILVERIRADAGMDIGNTIIGMHMKEVVVPVRLNIKKVGGAALVACRVRPKYIGGDRAIYDERLK